MITNEMEEQIENISSLSSAKGVIGDLLLTLKIARDRFVNPKFGVNWLDAAEDIDREIKNALERR